MEILNWKDVQHVNDICVMAPTLQLAEKAEMLIKQENYQNIDVVVAASGRQETVKCAQTLAAAGAEIIITRKGTPDRGRGHQPESREPEQLPL